MSKLPPKIFSTSEWGAKPARAVFQEGNAEGIILHNTETANRAALSGDAEVHVAFAFAKSIQNVHMDTNGWSDTGQHFTVTRGGVILEGRHGSIDGAHRGMVVQGAHAGRNAPDQNRHWFGIEIEGDNRASFQVTKVQQDAVIELCAWLAFWGNFDSMKIEGHKHFSDTDCPGHISDKIPGWRQLVHDFKVRIAASV